MVSEETVPNKTDVELFSSVPSTPIGQPPPLTSSSRQSSRIDLKSSAASVVCPFANEQHVGKEIISCLIDCPPQKIFALLFTDPEFMTKVFSEHKYYDVKNSDWETDSITGNLTRKITFTATLPSNALGPSTSMVTEIQTASSVNKDNELYVVNKESTNAGIPYADSFKLYSHYCITKVMTDTNGGNISTRFVFYCNVWFKKGTLFFIKNLIEKNAYHGCEMMGNTILSSLIREVKGETVPTRKRRKVPGRSKKPPPTKSYGKSTLGTIWLILGVLLAAGVANVYLYTRINHLESATYRDWIWRRQLSLSPSDDITEEFDKILAEGEHFYARQVHMWEEEILQIIKALNKIEHSLNEILDSVPQMKKHSQILAKFRKNFDSQPIPLQDDKQKTLLGKFTQIEI